MVTLGGVACAGRIGTCAGRIGTALCSLFVCLVKIFESSRSASICSVPIFAKGVAGDGCISASLSAAAAADALSADENFGIGHKCGKNSTVLQMRLALVRGTKTL